MTLNTEVTSENVTEAVRLIKTALQQSATNPTTGEIDMDILATGKSNSNKLLINKIADYIKTVEVRSRMFEYPV